MKKKKIRKRLEKAAKARQMCRIFTAGDSEEASRFLPLAISEELVYMIKDGDPEAYGYSVRSLDVIEKVKIEKEEEAPAEMAEKHASAAPELDIADWPSVFRSLGKYGRVIIVESEKLAKKDERYAVGKIEKIGRRQVTIRYYGPDTVWENKRWKVPYEHITWVTADSRYTEVLNQYVPEADRAAAAQIDREEADAGEPEISAGSKEA